MKSNDKIIIGVVVSVTVLVLAATGYIIFSKGVEKKKELKKKSDDTRQSVLKSGGTKLDAEKQATLALVSVPEKAKVEKEIAKITAGKSEEQAIKAIQEYQKKVEEENSGVLATLEAGANEVVGAGKLLYTTLTGKKYIISGDKGLAGERLRQVPASLQSYLRSHGYPDAKIGNNGVMRELSAAANPSSSARAEGSLHGAGLAIDVLFGGLGIKWDTIYDNSNLAANAKLTKTIWDWVQTQKDLTWGAEFGKSNPAIGMVKDRGITEYHHFEIKKGLIPNYWKPYAYELKELGFGTDLDTTSKLSVLYKKLLS